MFVMAGNEQPSFDVDINGVFYQLHEVAMKNSQAVAVQYGFAVANTGVDEKGKRYFGSGEYDIACWIDPVGPKFADRSRYYAEDSTALREDCFKVIQKYVEFFASDTYSKALRPDQLEPLRGETLSEKKIDYSVSLLENLFGEEDGDTADEPEPKENTS